MPKFRRKRKGLKIFNFQWESYLTGRIQSEKNFDKNSQPSRRKIYLYFWLTDYFQAFYKIFIKKVCKNWLILSFYAKDMDSIANWGYKLNRLV